MSTDRLVVRTIASWVGVVWVLAAGLIWLATAVESGSLGLGVAFGVAALSIPGVVTVLGPLLTCIGTSLAAARLQTLGEWSALQALGWSPWRLGLAPLLLGMMVGGSLWFSSGFLVPMAEEEVRALSGHEPAAWVWLEDGEAVRMADGLRVVAKLGTISALEYTDPATLSPEAVAAARMLQQPALASEAVLRDSPLVPALVERQGRFARVLGCAGLALLGWLPLTTRPQWRVVLAVSAGMGWQAVDALLQLAASQGRLPIELGCWTATALLWAGLLGGAWFRARP